MNTSMERQATTYLLINWHRYDLLADKLDYVNMQNMKNLYKGLSQLPEDERTFLAEKYHHSTGKITDDEASKISGLSKKEYTKERVKIERKLHELIIDDMENLNRETGFTPFAHRPRKRLDGHRPDIETGLRYMVTKDLERDKG